MVIYARHNYVWKIADFCSCPVGGQFQSPFYRTGNFKWKVRIYPESPPIADMQKFKMIFKGKSAEQGKELIAEINFEFGMYFYSKKMHKQKIFLESGTKYSFDFSFIQRFTSLKTNLHDNYLVDNVLACGFDVSISTDQPLNPAAKSHIGDLPSAKHCLLSDLATHLLKESPDITLRSSDGGQSFPILRLLLTARSKVFQKMLSTDMLENRTGYICLPDLTSSDLEQMVNYLYGREVNPVLMTARLYQAAHRYALADLQRRVSEALCQRLSVEDVCQVAALAHLHSDAGLFSEARGFILDNSCAVMMSDSYVKLQQESPEVAVALARGHGQQGGQKRKSPEGEGS